MNDDNPHGDKPLPSAQQRSNRLRALRALRVLEPIGYQRVEGALGGSSQWSASMGGALESRDTAALALQAGSVALARLRSDGAALDQLSSEEIDGLEAIVVTVGRPAITIRGGRFDPPPEPWTVLDAHRSSIEALLPSVGRIELRGHPSLDWVGTGFLVAPGVLATNRHVIQEFAQHLGQGQWRIDPGISAWVDFAEELDAPPREYPLNAILGVHSVFDVALLEVGSVGSRSVGIPMPLDGGGIALGPNRMSYVIGYPALDTRRNDEETMRRIFAGLYNVKRLQPGFLKDWSQPMQAYLHDCSTLGGNSGSCLVDLDSGVVVGIHFGGRFGQDNWAVSTRDLADDGYLQRLGARFR
jgi:hypothetical protein